MDELKKLAAREDIVNGKEAVKRFNALVDKVISVPREEILTREAEYKRTAHMRGKKRGPKAKRSVSHVADEGTDRTSEQPEA